MSGPLGSTGSCRFLGGDSDLADRICSGLDIVKSRSRILLVWARVMISNALASIVSVVLGVLLLGSLSALLLASFIAAVVGLVQGTGWYNVGLQSPMSPVVMDPLPNSGNSDKSERVPLSPKGCLLLKSRSGWPNNTEFCVNSGSACLSEEDRNRDWGWDAKYTLWQSTLLVFVM